MSKRFGFVSHRFKVGLFTVRYKKHVMISGSTRLSAQILKPLAAKHPLTPRKTLAPQHVSAVPFAAAYGALALVALVAMAAVSLVDFPAAPKKKKESSGGRPLFIIMRQRVFIVSTAATALGYGVMNMLMAASPIAMKLHGHSVTEAAVVLQWHVIGMFAPGFVTGHVIDRFGPIAILGAGVMLNLLCIAVALSGTDAMHFVVSLFVLGVGWNFLLRQAPRCH
jgi:predicted MFS family arabinose efflux permease